MRNSGGRRTTGWVQMFRACSLCRTAGFARVEFRGKLEHSACVGVLPGMGAGDNAQEAPQFIMSMHDRNFGINFRSGPG